MHCCRPARITRLILSWSTRWFLNEGMLQRSCHLSSIISRREEMTEKHRHCHHTTIKIRSEFRNVGDAVYAMSHISAEACTQWLAAGRSSACSSNRCWPMQRCTGSGPACYKLTTAGSYAAHNEMLWTEKGKRKGTESTQRDNPLHGSRAKPVVTLMWVITVAWFVSVFLSDSCGWMWTS